MNKTLNILYLLNKNDADQTLKAFLENKSPLTWQAILAAYAIGPAFFEDIVAQFSSEDLQLEELVFQLRNELSLVVPFGEAEKKYGLSPGTLRVNRKRGRIRSESCRKVGQKWYITLAEVERVFKKESITTH